MKRPARSRRSCIAALAFILSAVPGCGLFDDIGDRFKTCEDAEIVLLNSQQTRVSVNMIGPDEVFGQQNLLESGQSRRLVLCMDYGDHKTFQVRQGTEIVASVNCVAQHDSYAGRPLPSVIWTKSEILCEDW